MSFALTSADGMLCRHCTRIEGDQSGQASRLHFWEVRLRRSAVPIASALTQSWTRHLYEQFIEAEIARGAVRRAIDRLEDDGSIFRLLDERFEASETLSAVRILRRFRPEEIRRSKTVMLFLRQRQVEIPSPMLLSQREKLQAMRTLLSEATPAHAGLVQHYFEHLLESGWKAGSIEKPVRLVLRMLGARPIAEITEEFVENSELSASGRRLMQAFIRFVRANDRGDPAIAGSRARALTVPPPLACREAPVRDRPRALRLHGSPRSSSLSVAAAS